MVITGLYFIATLMLKAISRLKMERTNINTVTYELVTG